jgi:CHAT domain-containing protein
MLKRAKPLLETAVHLLPTPSPRQLKRKDAQFNISQFANLTARAVSLCLENMDDPYKSLQLLELGRGILANLQLEVRSDISVLAADHPEFAHKFQELRDQIDSPSSTLEPIMIQDQLAHVNANSSRLLSNRRMLLNQFDDLMAHIRSLHGFENFLQGPSKLELLSLAKDGPIVVFNVSDIRSDAFLITTVDIRCVRLPSLTFDSVKHFTRTSMSKVKQRKLNPTESDPQSKAKETPLDGHGDINEKRKATLIKNESPSNDMRTMLKWLWDAVVNPVLKELGFTETPDNEPWPHVWWITSGLLAHLPIHAAGDHRNGSNRNAIDRVISSYVPTLKSLAYSREKVKNQFDNDEVSKALLVAMSLTPSQSALPYAEKEVKEVGALIPDSITKTIVLQPSKREVLDSLAGCRLVHFACHGESNPDDPSKSRLLLQDWKDDPLSVEDITGLNLQNAAFVYLSACSAADSQVESLLDEGIHLAGAFQLAGYPSVVGTLWHISDEHSAKVAVDVYCKLCKKSSRINPDDVARALHLAVRKLRSEMEGKSENSLFWSPYVHMGV